MPKGSSLRALLGVIFVLNELINHTKAILLRIVMCRRGQFKALLGAIIYRRGHFGALLGAIMYQRGQFRVLLGSRNVPKGSFWSCFKSQTMPKGLLWSLLKSRNVPKESIGCSKQSLSIAIFKPFLRNTTIRNFLFLFHFFIF